MATTYKASFEFSCWKQHTCVGCEEDYQYVLTRKVQGEGGTEEAAYAAAQTAAVKAMDDDVDLQPCPKCGRVQPDMVAALRRPWYWAALLIGLAGVMVGFLPVFAHGFSIETSAWVSAIPLGLALLIAVLGSARNPNSNPSANVLRAERAMGAGTLRLAPAETTDGVVTTETSESPTGSRFDENGFEASEPVAGPNLVALGLLVVALLAVLAAPIVRIAAGWPINERWHPAVIGPGDSSTFYYDESLKSLKGYWHSVPIEGRDSCAALLTNAGELGIENAMFQGATKDSTWGNTINSDSKSDPSNRMWARIQFPAAESLENAEGKLIVATYVVYPATIAKDQAEERGKEFVENDVVLRFASAGAGGNYHQIWLMGQIAGMVLCLIAGVGLLRSAGGLVNAAYPTAVFPLEDAEDEEIETITDAEFLDDDVD